MRSLARAGFLGRFQPFHHGHYSVIEAYRDDYDLVIVIGSAGESRTEENPLSFEERKALIQECFPEIEVIGLEDEEKDEEGNRQWIEKLDDHGFDVIISRNKLVQRLVKEYSDAEIEEQELHDPNVYSGTEVRRRIKSGEEWRYLVPECAKEAVAEHLETIKESGIKYDFEPGWNRENSFYGTDE